MKALHSYKYYQNKIIQYDCINVFSLKKTQDLPKLKEVNLKFHHINLSDFSSFLSFVTLLTSSTGKYKIKTQLFHSKTQKINQKKFFATFYLRKNLMVTFLSKIRKRIISSKKLKINLDLEKLNAYNKIEHIIKRLLSFKLMKNNYILFKNLEGKNNLSMTLFINTKKIEKLIFILHSYKIINKTGM